MNDYHHHHDNNSNNNNTSDSNPRWVPCIARADFWGDARSSQLSFRKNARLEVDLCISPQNGWRWGKSGDRNGWFPEWAAVPIVPRSPTPVSEEQPPSSSCHNHRGLGRSKDRIVPLFERVSEREQKQRQQHKQHHEGDDSDGFDASHNEIMGGNLLPRAHTVERVGNNDGAFDHSEGHKKRLGSNSASDNVIHSWKEKWSTMAKGHNLYTKHQKQPDWDGSEVPQIVSGVDGTVTVIGADGKASSYKNEKSYKIAETKNRIAEHFSKTSQTVERKITGFWMPPLKRSGSKGTSSSNAKENDQPSRQEPTAAPTKESPPGKHKKERFGKLPKMPRRRSNHTSLSNHY
jgi:hypothetical protein